MLGWDASGEALHAPATLRNREPILAVLRRILPARGTVLEIASGSGEHAVHFAGALPDLRWLPSDPDEEALRSIRAHRAMATLGNLEAPVRLDAAADAWPVARADAVVAINMIHIAPPAATLGLMAGAGRLLGPGGCLVLYGPFVEADRETMPGNRAFDADLRLRNPDWGLRELGQVAAVAQANGLALAERIAMPADNLSIVFRKAAGPQPPGSGEGNEGRTHRSRHWQPPGDGAHSRCRECLGNQIAAAAFDAREAVLRLAIRAPVMASGDPCHHVAPRRMWS